MGQNPVLKFGGLTMQGRDRYGSDEEGLLQECRQLACVNDIYRLLEGRRNAARAMRLQQICEGFIVPLMREGTVPVVVVSAFDWATDKLQQLARCVHHEPNDREYARLLMSGELRSNAALAMALDCAGCPAHSLTGREAGIMTTPQAVEALVERVDATRISDLLAEGVVPVVAGFQGYHTDPATGREEVSILGRGGSNLTAVAIAHALGEPECTMFTDVDGLYTKDPRQFEDAQKLDGVHGRDLLDWDPFPRVIQKEAVLYALECRVDIWIRDGFDPAATGSRIECHAPLDVDV